MITMITSSEKRAHVAPTIRNNELFVLHQKNLKTIQPQFSFIVILNWNLDALHIK